MSPLVVHVCIGMGKYGDWTIKLTCSQWKKMQLQTISSSRLDRFISSMIYVPSVIQLPQVYFDMY